MNWIELLYFFYDGEYMIWALVCKSWHKFLKRVSPTTSFEKIINIKLFDWARCDPAATMKIAIKNRNHELFNHLLSKIIVTKHLLRHICMYGDEYMYIQFVAAGCSTSPQINMVYAITENNILMVKYFLNVYDFKNDIQLMSVAYNLQHIEILRIFIDRDLPCSNYLLHTLSLDSRRDIIDMIYKKKSISI
jgi:hypothetical protein